MVEPDYYASNGLSPLKAYEQGLLSKEEYIGFLKGNVIKYTVRAGKKDDPLMDIFKAIDYLHYLHKALNNEDESEDDAAGMDTGVRTMVAGYPVDFNDPAFKKFKKNDKEESKLKKWWTRFCKSLRIPKIDE